MEEGSLLDLLSFKPIVALDGVLGPDQRLLDFHIYAGHQSAEMVHQLLLVFPLVLVMVWVIFKLFLKIDVVSLRTGSSVMLGVREQVTGAEVEQVELADIFVGEVISFVESDVQREVAVFPH